MAELVGPLLIAAALGVGCTLFHITCMLGLNRAIRVERKEETLSHEGKLSARGFAFTVVLFGGLFVVHGVEILAFAMTYLWLGALPNVESALYYSTISYSTVGYEDTQVLHQWRMIGAIESMVGIMLIGWSTAFSLRLLSRLDT